MAISARPETAATHRALTDRAARAATAPTSIPAREHPMRNVLTIVAAIVVAAVSPALAADPLGKWLTKDNKATVTIAHCGDALCGTIIALKLLFRMPMIWGCAITALDTFLLLALQRVGIRKLEAVILTLVATIGPSRARARLPPARRRSPAGTPGP